VLGGLSPDEAATAVDFAWNQADDNGDGGISHKEFAAFIASLGRAVHVDPRLTPV
jgi:hypothetical protein